MARSPALFVSHGSPEIAVRETAAHSFLKQLGDELARPRAILVVSAHWGTAVPVVGASARPETIHDFGDFDRRLRDMVYSAPGAVDVALEAKALLEDFGSAVGSDPNRGYDHGVWTPLVLLHPPADIPVAMVSIQPHEGPSHHYRLGSALSPLRDQSVLLIASGALTHNLPAFRGQPIDAPVPEWVESFRDWMQSRLEAGDVDALLDYRHSAPFAAENHPTDEHLLPLFVALGAAHAEEPIRRLHGSVEYGVIAMDAYRFG